ncbi:uncharacterized protein LOC121521728 [Cheilinus undulatus]|uniref:uncharacterized protein LOC121521728 n=1 Tax=Cheilinus undulatus TaxID=241271 RepID=UPI001BD52F77|nr:uncharacterized protein LOC121521728 [Cheilinus undulatus]
MAEQKWISLFILVLFQFAAAAYKKNLTARVGDDISLPCDNARKEKQECKYTAWVFTGLNNKPVRLVTFGQFGEFAAESKLARLNVTKDCSLRIRTVTEEDAGLYECVQYTGKGKQDSDVVLNLTVISGEETQDTHFEKTEKSSKTGNATDPSTLSEDSTELRQGCSVLDVAMFALRVAELLMVSVLTVLLFRTRGNKRPPDVNTVYCDRVSYEKDGEPSSSVRLH